MTFVVVCEGDVLVAQCCVRTWAATWSSCSGRPSAVAVSGGAVDGLSALIHLHDDLVGMINQHGCPRGRH
jgi:hypothetical protein